MSVLGDLYVSTYVELRFNPLKGKHCVQTLQDSHWILTEYQEVI